MIPELHHVNSRLLKVWHRYSYDFFYNLKKQKGGGGSGLAVKSEYGATEIYRSNDESYESILVLMEIDENKAIFGSGYIPPRQRYVQVHDKVYEKLAISRAWWGTSNLRVRCESAKSFIQIRISSTHVKNRCKFTREKYYIYFM